MSTLFYLLKETFIISLMKRYYCLLFIVFLLGACKHRSVFHDDNITIINFAQKSHNNIEELLETDFIKLETCDNSLIGSYVAQIEAVKEKLFILTGGTHIKLLVFDVSGKFDCSIGNVGRGPGEYIVPISFSVNYNDNIISIVDIAQKKIINYNLDNYEFVTEKIMEYDSFCFEYFGNDKIVWKNANYRDKLSDWDFIVTDIEQNFFKKHIQRDFKTGYFTGPPKNIYKTNGHVYAYTQYNPIVYHFFNDDVVPVYQIKFGKHKMPPLDYLQKISAENNNFISTLTASNFISYYCVFDAVRTLSIFYSVSQNQYIGVFDKINKQLYHYSKDAFQDKLKIGEMERPVGIIDNYVVALIHPYYLLEKIEEGYVLDNRLYPLVSNSKADDNPFLFLFRFKEL